MLSLAHSICLEKHSHEALGFSREQLRWSQLDNRPHLEVNDWPANLLPSSTVAVFKIITIRSAVPLNLPLIRPCGPTVISAVLKTSRIFPSNRVLLTIATVTFYCIYSPAEHPMKQQTRLDLCPLRHGIPSLGRGFIQPLHLCYCMFIRHAVGRKSSRLFDAPAVLCVSLKEQVDIDLPIFCLCNERFCLKSEVGFEHRPLTRPDIW